MSCVKVLVLEDDPNMRAVLAQVLTAQGFQVTAVARGEEAVEKARAETFDLIVADIRMEGMDGLEALAQARALQPEVGTLIVSGYATPEETARASRLGVGGYLRKPFKTRDLLEQIQRILKRDAEGRQHQERGEALEQAFYWGLESLARLADHLALSGPKGSLVRAGQVAEALGRELGLDPGVVDQLRLAAMTADLLEHSAFEKPPFLEEGADVCPALKTAAESRHRRYPDQPLEARILAVALEAGRDLEEGAPPPAAAELERRDPGRLDPAVLQVYDRTRPGSPPVAPARPARDGSRRGGSLLSLARALEQAGDPENAWKAYDEVLQVDSRPRARVDALLGKAELCLRQGQPGPCQSQVREALRNAQMLGPVAAAEALLQSGLLLFRSRGPEADRVLSQALESCRTLGLEAAEAQARVALARLQAGSQPVELGPSLKALGDPRHLSEAVRASEWLLGTLVELAGLCQDKQPAAAALRLAGHLPGSLESLLEKGVSAEARLYLVEAALEPGGSLASRDLVDRLTNDPDPLVRGRAEGLRHRALATAGRPLFRVHSFGVFQVYRGERQVEEQAWRSPRVKHLFAFLASRWGRPIPDERIIEEFWPDHPADKARRSLYWTTSILRKCLRGEDDRLLDLVVRQREALLMDPELPHWHDLEELERASEAGLRADEQGRPEEASIHFRRLGQLYTGPFMDGCYMEWALRRRTAVEQLVVEGLSRLASYSLERKQPAEALEAARTVLTLAPGRQESHLQAMQAWLGLREPEKAVEQFRSCERVLREEYEMEPSTELLEYYHRARLGMCGS